MSTIIPRLASASASWCSGRPASVLAPERQPVERQEQRAQVPRTDARRQPAENAVVERHQACRVALAGHQVRERGGQARSVLALRHRARAVAHRRADVEQQVRAEVRLLLVLLHVIPVGPRVHLPVDRGEIVARQVLPVLRELHAEPLQRAAVQPRQEALDDGARLELEAADPRDDGGIEEPRLAGSAGWSPPRHTPRPLFGGGTDSIRRETTPSEVTCSDSA